MELINRDHLIERLTAAQKRPECGLAMFEMIGIVKNTINDEPVVIDTDQAPTYGGDLELWSRQDLIEACNNLYLSLVLTIRERDKIRRELEVKSHE